MIRPYEKLKALTKAKDHLNPGPRLKILDATAHRLNDNQAADLLQKARQQLFTTIHDRTHNTGELTITDPEFSLLYGSENTVQAWALFPLMPDN